MMKLALAALALINGVLGFWAVDVHNFPGKYNMTWVDLKSLQTTNSTVKMLCALSLEKPLKFGTDPGVYGGCVNTTSVAMVGKDTTLYYLQHLDKSKIGCQLSESNDDLIVIFALIHLNHKQMSGATRTKSYSKREIGRDDKN
ncbi:hypothetical protein DM01DRAFT_1107628 [Hesseltinella vesiculosa]|uniref:Uncharacterized protein n=1 Tax=Hesseltinella vesiculosa TaxID=101127 RepID=A0A1X2GB87_9FUNG|nr:hypothetical protein DM01DRAFT_1107628 [Hesseltinella vesiculosa]